ncbi:uroporphyrinogen-III synthase [Evansella halocellulosilytica]|uniref:uroporphyrinogen-III synthase n=1 Tax=Evansella halocellulosilytica TaxID=2011013 RepID=UPI000BB6C5DA|nr:uroporphyrinogen-III synthase [Evansella halocellulosilytica]
MTSLQDLRILNPRAAHQANPLTKVIERHGGISVELPLIHIKMTSNMEPVRHKLRSLTEYDWVVFTSVNSIRFLLQALAKDHIERDILMEKQIAVVGEKTEQFLIEAGLKADLVPHTYDAEHLAQELKKKLSDGEKVFFPRGNLARNVIVYELTQAGIDIDEVIIYETGINEEAEKGLHSLIIKNQLDVVLFTSPSTVRAFFSLIKKSVKSQFQDEVTFAVIGTVTANELRKHGVTKMIIPNEYTIEGMMEALKQNFTMN